MHPAINLEWWNALSNEWKDIFEKNTRSNPQQSDFFKKVANLKKIDCGGIYSQNAPKVKIYDLEPVRNLVNLKTLICWNTEISSLEPLRELVKLTELCCNSTQVSDLEPLQKLINLTKFNCRYTQVSDLEPLRDKLQLKELYCYASPVSNLEPLRELVNLKILYFHETQVSSLAPLENLVNLTELGCIYGNSAIDKRDIESFKQKNPKCKIKL